MSTIEEAVKLLPPNIRVNVRVYIDSLIEKQRLHPVKPLSQDWAGGFSEFKSEYTSMGLQKIFSSPSPPAPASPSGQEPHRASH